MSVARPAANPTNEYEQRLSEARTSKTTASVRVAQFPDVSGLDRVPPP